MTAARRETPQNQAEAAFHEPRAAGLALVHRPRRNRKADWARRLVREHVLTVDDLIWPIFLIEGHDRREAVKAMPGVDRVSVDEAVRVAARAAKLGIPVLALFPYTEPGLRDAAGIGSAAGHQSGVPGLPGHQGGGAGPRPADRCGARPLYQPRA